MSVGSHNPRNMSLNLSVVMLRRDTRRMVRDAQSWHGIVRRCVPAGEGQRVLWALPSPDHLVVQSPEPLDERRWVGLAERMWSTQVRNEWSSGDTVRLSLIANPTRSEFVRGLRGVRRPLPIGEVEAWVQRRLNPAVRCDAVAVQDLGVRSGQRDTGIVAHRLVAIAASATVTCPETLAGLVRDGVGAGKSYGAGLLIVGRAT